MIQLQVLNYILDSKDPSFLLMNNLTKEFFSDYSEEFEFINSHYLSYGKIPDKLTLLEKFPDFDIIEVEETPKYLIDALYEDKNRRDLTVTFNNIRKLLNENNVEAALEEYNKSFDRMSSATHLDSVDILKDTSRYDAYIDKLENLDSYFVTTGLKELDELLGGGWDRQEELATIVARTNMGKTWLLLKSAIAAAEQGLNVGLYSGEMSEDKIGYRVDSLVSHISNGAITHGNDSVRREYTEFIDKLKNGLIKGSLKVLTPAMISGTAGVTALRAFIEKEKLDMLCIDQHSLLDDDRHAKNPVERASNISKDLKNLQVLKRIPIITVSQQNRASTDNGLNTTMIAQSDRIGQDSTVVLFFEQKDGIMTLSLTKARDVANGKELQYTVNFDKGVFEYMPNSLDGTDSSNVESLRDEYELSGEDPW